MKLPESKFPSLLWHRVLNNEPLMVGINLRYSKAQSRICQSLQGKFHDAKHIAYFSPVRMGER